MNIISNKRYNNITDILDEAAGSLSIIESISFKKFLKNIIYLYHMNFNLK